MPCMCGDLYCWSCGSAQGNYRCEQCGAWSADGGCKKPKQCEEANKKLAEEEAKFYLEDQKFWEEEEKAQKDYYNKE